MMILHWVSWHCICLIVCMHNTIVASVSSCPTWFYENATSRECICGVYKLVTCDPQEGKVEIQQGICVTSSEQQGQYYVGQCPFAHTINNTNRMYSQLPIHPDKLNDVMCGPYNRKGLLCGRCIDGYGPGINPFDLKCANCSRFSTVYAISLYLVVELVPSTLFFICVVIFRINITAGPLLGYVLFCQLYSSISQTFVPTYIYIESEVSVPFRVFLLISLTLCEFWNMNILKPVIPPFCISEKLTGIHIIMLSFVTLIYPLVLLIITSFLIELHAKNCRIIHILWKPFGIILGKMNITAVNSDLIIHAFATFILLSSTANAYNLMALFEENTVFMSINGTTFGKYMYFDSTVIYLSHVHIVYLSVAVVISMFLVLIPSLLLCVYPTRIYTSLSQCISARVRLVIMTFAEALHCCFKDGLHGTRDYRSLAGLVIVSLPAYSYINIGLKIVTGYQSYFIASYIFFVVSLSLSYIRPCKSSIANLSLGYHFTILGILSMAKGLWDEDLTTGTETLAMTFYLLPTISHILTFIWVGYTIFHYIHLHCCGHPSACIRPLTQPWNHCFHRRHGGYLEILPSMSTQSHNVAVW